MRLGVGCKALMLVAAGAAALTMASPVWAAADDLPSREEMWRIIQLQQQQIDDLKQRLGTTEKKVAVTEERVEVTGAMVESVSQQASEPGVTGGWWERTQLGGYGELHYNGGAADQIDFHRFVLFVSHDFNEDIRLFSELELEHALAGDGQPGEVELEQAYVEFDLTEDDAHRAKAGLFLVPVGILNETHEPPTFFGVERNPVENNIIPSTWWEAGGALSGRFGESGFSYDVAAHSGLQVPVAGGNAYRIRNGRQKVANAEATDFAYTGRVKWTGYPGVELGAAGQFQSDVTQNAADNEDVEAILWEAHADLRRGPWGLRALYARWDLDGAGPEAIGRDEQYGWYVEPSYRFDTPIGAAGVFGRYNFWDNAAGGNGDSEFQQTDVGINYWPYENVVLKADYAFIDGPDGDDDDERLNLGVGFQF